MSIRYESWGGARPEDIVNNLMVRSMKRHYADFVLNHGHSEANIKMGRLFGADMWEPNKAEINRWLENDFYRDDDGNVVV